LPRRLTAHHQGAEQCTGECAVSRTACSSPRREAVSVWRGTVSRVARHRPRAARLPGLHGTAVAWLRSNETGSTFWLRCSMCAGMALDRQWPEPLRVARSVSHTNTHTCKRAHADEQSVAFTHHRMRIRTHALVHAYMHSSRHAHTNTHTRVCTFAHVHMHAHVGRTQVGDDRPPRVTRTVRAC
jgi:hypothetical protein